MFNEEALEFVVDQNLYYPAATNYGYYCSQFELVADGGRGFCNFSLHINFIHSCQIYGIQGCIALEELYFSHNGITKTEGLSSLVNLQVLDVSSNKLISVDDIPNLTQLDDLWLSDNQIESLKGIVEAVAGSREKLTIIYLENNPCNTKKEKMEMTTPIFTSKNQSDGVKMDMTTAVLTTKWAELLKCCLQMLSLQLRMRDCITSRYEEIVEASCHANFSCRWSKMREKYLICKTHWL